MICTGVLILVFLTVTALVFHHWWTCWRGNSPELSHFTHRARIGGIPCYYRSDGEGCDIAGTNVLYDWLILAVVPPAFGIVETIRAWEDPDYEPSGWPIQLREPLH